MAKTSSSLVCSQQKCEGQNISAIVSKIFKLIVFQIDHVSLTSTNSCRCDSYCLARVFQNLPAPPKLYGVFDVFCDFQSFFERENLGSHLAMCFDDRFLAQGRQICQKICQVCPMPKTILEALVGYLYWFLHIPPSVKVHFQVCFFTNILMSCLKAITYHHRMMKRTILLNHTYCLQFATHVPERLHYFLELIITTTQN